MSIPFMSPTTPHSFQYPISFHLYGSPWQINVQSGRVVTTSRHKEACAPDLRLPFDFTQPVTDNTSTFYSEAIQEDIDGVLKRMESAKGMDDVLECPPSPPLQNLEISPSFSTSLSHRHDSYPAAECARDEQVSFKTFLNFVVEAGESPTDNDELGHVFKVLEPKSNKNAEHISQASIGQPVPSIICHRSSAHMRSTSTDSFSTLAAETITSDRNHSQITDCSSLVPTSSPPQTYRTSSPFKSRRASEPSLQMSCRLKDVQPESPRSRASAYTVRDDNTAIPKIKISSKPKFADALLGHQVPTCSYSWECSEQPLGRGKALPLLTPRRPAANVTSLESTYRVKPSSPSKILSQNVRQAWPKGQSPTRRTVEPFPEPYPTPTSLPPSPSRKAAYKWSNKRRSCSTTGPFPILSTSSVRMDTKKRSRIEGRDCPKDRDYVDDCYEYEDADEYLEQERPKKKKKTGRRRPGLKSPDRPESHRYTAEEDSIILKSWSGHFPLSRATLHSMQNGLCQGGFQERSVSALKYRIYNELKDQFEQKRTAKGGGTRTVSKRAKSQGLTTSRTTRN